jgi:hypothetical protein
MRAHRRMAGPAECEQVLSLPSWYYGEEIDDLTSLGIETE